MAIVGAALQIAFWAIVIPTGFYLLTQTISNVMYAIGMMFFAVMDMLQSTFRKLAGLGGGSIIVQGKKSDGDLLTALLASDTVIDVLLSVAVFGVGLIIVASIVQIIRLEYTTEGSKNSKEQIFAKAGKSIIMFILIPIVCFVGIRVSNYLLQAIDYATSAAGSSTVSGTIFVSAASEANKVYDDKNLNGFHIDISNLLGSLILNNIPGYGKPNIKNGYIDKFQDKFTTTKSGTESKGDARTELAQKVNQAFCYASTDSEGILQPGMPLSAQNVDGTILTKIDKLSYMNLNAVNYFYHLGNINYLILYLGCYFGIKTLFTACMGLIARLYKVAALFVISPAAIGLQPLDDGAAYKKWKGEFIKNILSAYGIIIALNLYFMVVGVLSTVELFPGFWNYAINCFVRFMMVLTGATMINDLSTLIGGLIGAGDVMADGAKATSAVGELASKVGSVAGGAIAGGAGVAKKLAAGAAKKKKIGGKDGMSLSEINKTKKDFEGADADLSAQQASFDSKYKSDGNGGFTTADGKAVDMKNDKDFLAAQQQLEATKKTHAQLKAKNDKGQALLNTDEGANASRTALSLEMSANKDLNRFGNMVKNSGLASTMKNLSGNIVGYMDGSAFKDQDQAFLDSQPANLRQYAGPAGQSSVGLDSAYKGVENGLLKTERRAKSRAADQQNMAASAAAGEAREADRAVQEQAYKETVTKLNNQRADLTNSQDAIKRDHAGFDKEVDNNAVSEAANDIANLLQKGQGFVNNGAGVDNNIFNEFTEAVARLTGNMGSEGSVLGDNTTIQRLVANIGDAAFERDENGKTTENQVDDETYRQNLAAVFDEFRKNIPMGAAGLDIDKMVRNDHYGSEADHEAYAKLGEGVKGVDGAISQVNEAHTKAVAEGSDPGAYAANMEAAENAIAKANEALKNNLDDLAKKFGEQELKLKNGTKISLDPSQIIKIDDKEITKSIKDLATKLAAQQQAQADQAGAKDAYDKLLKDIEKIVKKSKK